MTLKATTENVVSLAATKLTGAIPALDGTALTGIATGPTKSANDPTISTNPSGVGVVWENTTTSNIYVCVDATAGKNIWVNVGDGTDNISPYVFQGKIEGYVAGGQVVGSPAHNNIQKYSFSSNTGGNDLGNLTRVSYIVAGCSSDTYGYQAGGLNVSTIDKFQFATLNNASSHGSLTAVRHSVCATNNGTHGFAAGGQSFQASIEKYAFASNTTAAAHGNLTEASNARMGCSSETHGFAGGGYNNGLSPTFRTTIDKFAFASNTTAAGHGNLATLRSNGSATSSTTDGYMASGANNGGDQLVIEKVSFASNTTASNHGNLTNARDGLASSSEMYNGYSAGGQKNSGPGNAANNVIDKFVYASTTTAVDHGDLAQGSFAASGHHY